MHAIEAGRGGGASEVARVPVEHAAQVGGLEGRHHRLVVDVWAWSGFTSDKLDLFVASDANAPAWQLVTTLTPTRAGLNTLSATAVLPSGFSSAQAIRAQFRYGGSATPCVAGSYNDRDDLVFMPY